MSHRKTKPIRQMSDTEIRGLYKRRSLTFSWVAFLDGESERTVSEYMRNAMRGIAEVDKEIINREMQVGCH